MNRRGLTLLELILALGLLGTLAASAFALATAWARSAQNDSLKSNWMNSAAATLRVIEADIRIRDFSTHMEDRVVLTRNKLVIPTRASPFSGEERAEYTRTPSGEIVRRITGPDRPRSDPDVLLGQVAELRCEKVVPESELGLDNLRVELRAAAGWSVVRIIPTESRIEP